MPRTYFAKKKKKNDSEDMKKAVDAVQKGEHSIRKATEQTRGSWATSLTRTTVPCIILH